MGRPPRVTQPGLAYHVLNRRVMRLPLFQKDDDYLAFERVLVEAHLRHPMRILAYCLMPNHWHLLLYPRADGQLTAFIRWAPTTGFHPADRPPTLRTAIARQVLTWGRLPAAVVCARSPAGIAPQRSESYAAQKPKLPNEPI